MEASIGLEDFLEGFAFRRGERSAAVATTIKALAEAGRVMVEITRRGPLAGKLAAARGVTNFGDSRKELDLKADAIIVDALRTAPVAVIGSEEMDEPLVLAPQASLAVAIDPLDGSSNIDVNAPIGTIFSILEMPSAAAGAIDTAFFQRGRDQLAAGFLIYGPHTALVLTLGKGTHIFTFDHVREAFVLCRHRVHVPERTREYAINASNQRHWDESIQLYVQDCQQGCEGPRGEDFNMRWIASMVAEAYRILMRGGVYLYPADARQGYAEGRLRLVYEANPIAFIMEQAGGAAVDGHARILDIVPRSLHQRVPLIFGSRAEVERIARYCAGPAAFGERSPLFRNRTLFRM